jgi:hypothetical protein
MAKNKDDLKDQLYELIDWDDFRQALKELVEPRDRLNAYMGILPYVLPKLQAVQQDITTRQKDAVAQLLESMSAIPDK